MAKIIDFLLCLRMFASSCVVRVVYYGLLFLFIFILYLMNICVRWCVF
uniref:Uncharacterized protein n=1 Tax=Anguilla anguilla TaxID=7936 RepID=A0A0E9PQH8_ANGAN